MRQRPLQSRLPAAVHPHRRQGQVTDEGAEGRAGIHEGRDWAVRAAQDGQSRRAHRRRQDRLPDARGETGRAPRRAHDPGRGRRGTGGWMAGEHPDPAGMLTFVRGGSQRCHSSAKALRQYYFTEPAPLDLSLALGLVLGFLRGCVHLLLEL